MTTIERMSGPAGLVFHAHRRSVTVNEVDVPLTEREIDLLRVLLEDRGRVVPFDELALRVWGFEAAGDHRFIYTTAWRLRQALTRAGAPDVIEGMRGVGYSIRPDETHRSSGIRVYAVFDPSDPEWLLSMVNAEAVELTGHEIETLTTVPGAAMSIWRSDDQALLDEATERALTTGEACVIPERRLIRADGRNLRVDVALSRLDVPNQSALGLAIVTPSRS